MRELAISCRHHKLNSNCKEKSLGDYVRELAIEAKAHEQKLLVMRNYQELPDRNLGNDIDVMIPRNATVEWRKIINNVCTQFGLDHRTGHVLLYVSPEYISRVNNSELQIDIEPRMNWRGIDWISNDDCINRARPFREDIWILHPADECVISFCSSYLYGGFVKERYLDLMSEQASRNCEEVLRLMTHIFGKTIADEIVVSLAKKDINKMSAKATKYRIMALIRGFTRHPLTFVFTFCLGYYLEFRNKLISRKKLD